MITKILGLITVLSFIAMTSVSLMGLSTAYLIHSLVKGISVESTSINSELQKEKNEKLNLNLTGRNTMEVQKN